MLTPAEQTLLSTFRVPMSDARRCAMLGLTLNQAHTLARQIREKLNLAPGVTLRDAAARVVS